jgi:proteasome lid subunit RPN8/RPN11
VIAFAPSHLKQITEAAEAAYPEECCGLLVGHSEPSGGRVVMRVVASPNVAKGGARDRFEVDPQVRFNVQRALEDGPECIVGHYHSHPDHPAQPSERDLEMAWEPDLVWLIIAVENGRATETTAHLLDRGEGRFHPMRITVGIPSALIGVPFASKEARDCVPIV